MLQVEGEHHVSDYRSCTEATEKRKCIFLNASAEDRNHGKNLVDSVIQNCSNVNESNTSILGSQQQHETCMGIEEYLIYIFRICNLHDNEQQTILSASDRLILIQLTLAQLNKQEIGDFDVESSKVLLTDQKMKELKMSRQYPKIADGLQITSCDDGLEETMNAYHRNSKACNVVDLFDVYTRVFQDLESSGNKCRDIINEKNLIIFTSHFSEFQKAVLSLLCKDADIFIAKPAEIPLTDDSFNEDVALNIMPSNIVDVTDNLHVSNTENPSIKTSTTETYIEQVIHGYFELLINTRSELALSRILNVPDRGLDHKAFTAIKHEAKEKKMSMYQTTVSYVLRLRLGGRSYQPSTSHRLSQHIKGLGEFVDFTQKLQTIIEETPDACKAIKRILNCLKTTISKSGDDLIRPQSIENVVRTMLFRMIRNLDLIKKIIAENPKNASCGGSSLGRETQLILRQSLDHSAGLDFTRNRSYVLSDMITSQKTPMRLPSLLSRFRSPLEESPKSRASLSLAERMKEKQKKKRSKIEYPKYESNMDWAKPVHDVGLREISNTVQQSSLYLSIPSKTIYHGRSECSDSSTSVTNKVLESIQDQENCIEPDLHQLSVNSSSKKSFDLPPARCQINGKTSKNAKRKAPQKGSSVAKKAKKCSKKSSSIQKGQMTLTTFFRI